MKKGLMPFFKKRYYICEEPGYRKLERAFLGRTITCDILFLYSNVYREKQYIIWAEHVARRRSSINIGRVEGNDIVVERDPYSRLVAISEMAYRLSPKIKYL